MTKVIDEEYPEFAKEELYETAIIKVAGHQYVGRFEFSTFYLTQTSINKAKVLGRGEKLSSAICMEYAENSTLGYILDDVVFKDSEQAENDNMGDIIIASFNKGGYANIQGRQWMFWMS